MAAPARRAALRPSPASSRTPPAPPPSSPCSAPASAPPATARPAAGSRREPAPLVVYASEMAHSSIEKAALLAGFGRENLRLLPTDDAHALRPDALADALRTDVAAGHRPCAIVATVGSTGTTAIDPVARIGELARAHGAWLHVDAAMAGTAMACPELRWMWEGVEQADSVVWNPHKWLGIGFDCTAYHVRDPDHLVRVMATDPSYLRTAQDGAVKNYRDWGIALGRRFRALKVWFVLSALGVEGIRARGAPRTSRSPGGFADRVDATPGWERLAPVPLQTVCLPPPSGPGSRAGARRAQPRARPDQSTRRDGPTSPPRW